MYYIGIDIGSTAAKTVVRGDASFEFVLPTGWSSKETAMNIKKQLSEKGISIGVNTKVVATGYGRISVDFADKVVTEITCHGKGGGQLCESKDCTIIDVGGQDTKVIIVSNGMVGDFLMNDKCSAGTGKFIEIMANRLGVTLEELFELASLGKALSISSLCTVFAESEVISYIGEGQKREDIAAGVITSVAGKVAQLAMRKSLEGTVLLTGGLSKNAYFRKILSEKLGKEVKGSDLGIYAGALGAAIIGGALK